MKKGIYKHYKGNLYKITEIAYLEATGEEMAIYHQCDENGIFKSIRNVIDGKEIIVNQPFCRPLKEFKELIFTINGVDIYRFQFIK